jgi:Flp pilus assembly protein TadB
MTPVVVLVGAGIGVGIALVISGIWSTGPPVGRMSMMKRLDPANRQAAICAVILALMVGLVTRWPVGAAIGGAVGWTLRSALQPNTSRRVTGRLEALAAWIEALRDSIAAHRGLLAAIESTVNTAPPSIRDNVAALVVRIKSGMALDSALYAFAGELGDAAVDEAIAPLILASRFGGSDLQGLLATAAGNTRDQIALWQRIEIARAKPRRDMRLVIAVTLVFTLGVLLIGHGYFKPFGTPVGQIVLLAVAGLFASGFGAMNRLSRPQPMPRLFDSPSALPARSKRPAASATPAPPTKSPPPNRAARLLHAGRKQEGTRWS